jgi:lipopolysaccharide export system permease protein
LLAGTESSKHAGEQLHTTLSAEFLGLAVAEVDAMGLRELLEYAEHLKHNDLDSTRFDIAFWARIARLAALALVVILALPFALGPMRGSGQGARTVAGFMLLSQTLENGGQIFGVPPWLVGWIPTFGLAALTGVLLWRTR